MAARWLGLARPNFKIPRVNRPFSRTLKECTHALGASAVLVMAAGLNFALYPEALAAVVSGERSVIGFVPDEPGNGAAVPAAEEVQVAEHEVRLLAATVWGEARSEGEDGMRAVAHVMVNRIGERFGEDLTTVILTPKQFSVWNRGDPNRRLVTNLVREPDRYVSDAAAWDAAQRIAREVLSGQSADPTGGALFYHTRAVRPSWARYGVGRRVLGAHIFYADVPDAGQRRTPRVTNVAHIFGEPIPIDPPASRTASRTGPRAGRVNGVIQRAPAALAHQPLPSERSTGAATPTLNGVPITALRN